ncbi:MAG TPA: CHAT domain-containing protein [Saprospiraceae bacterium]|nr:CHAT domain-containing protein [Saprospiraceae bacterium]
MRYALEIQSERGAEQFRIIPILLDGFSRGGLKNWFDEELIDIPSSTAPGGLQESLPALLTALGLRLPEDPEPDLEHSGPESPVNELLLVLKNSALYTKEGKRRGMATAKLELHPADGSPVVESEDFEFISPLGPIEAGRLKDYIEEYPCYPFLEKILPKVAEVERQIPIWGKSLLEAITPTEDAGDVLRDWLATPADNERRFSIKIDATPPKDLPEASRSDYLEAASILLSTPWEILHDGQGFLFQGQRPVRVKRMLPNRHKKEAMPLQDVLRILLVVPRPEDEVAGLIDHRAATRALLETMDRLGDLAELDILETPTFPALSVKIRDANKAGKPFSVVHFDGHGVFDRDKRRGALCFERHEAQEQAKTEGRATAFVDTDALAAELRELRIPLFFLDACQSAMTDHDPTASVAATLLENGVASVAAMSHSVLVTTAEKFATAFYQRLAEGALIGSAMLAGQQALYADPVRMDLPDGDKLRLQDWFVPVLFQEKKDPQLVRKIPSRAAREVDQKAWKIKLGDTPDAPKHGFVGRDRELLCLERLLLRERWAVLIGQGGAGKTTLANEFARWMLCTRRFGRLAFVSFEFLSDTRSALDALGKQLVAPDFSVATFENEEKAMLRLDRALRDYPTLIVLDNLESVLPEVSRKSPEKSGQAIMGMPQSEEPERDTPATDLRDTIPGVAPVQEFIAFFQRILESSDRTRLLLTTRERMPAPFHRGDREVRLGALAPHDALRLIAEVMKTEGIPVPSLNSEDLEAQFGALARTANYHARALTLLTRAIAERRDGLPGLNADLSALMVEMERKHPGDRENSLFASVELSLRRLPEGMREVVDALAVFHGGADLVSWAMVAERGQDEIAKITMALVKVGLAEILFDKFPYYFRLDPALPAYLSIHVNPIAIEAWRTNWMKGMEDLTIFLYNQRGRDTQLAHSLTLLNEHNLLAFLSYLNAGVELERVIRAAGMMESLFVNLGHVKPLAFVQNILDQNAAQLSEWGSLKFNVTNIKIDRLVDKGDLQNALKLAKQVLYFCQQAGENAYREASYHLAEANMRLGRVLKAVSKQEQALPLLEEAQERFLKIAATGNQDAEHMRLACLIEAGDCFRDLGQYEKAAMIYETVYPYVVKQGDPRSIAVNRGQLATLRMRQKRYSEALKLYEDVKLIFEQQPHEPSSLATAWYQIGMTHQEMGNYDAAEKSYYEALTIRIRYKNRDEETAAILNQLGILYDITYRFEDAVRVFKQGAEVYCERNDLLGESFVRRNLFKVLLQLNHYIEARQQLLRAIECSSQFGHVAETWKIWELLARLELAENNSVATVEARQKASRTYATYRQDGGESQSTREQLFAAAYQAILVGETGLLLEQLSTFDLSQTDTQFNVLYHLITTILHGNRDIALAEDSELYYMDAVELRLLLEQLNREGI